MGIYQKAGIFLKNEYVELKNKREKISKPSQLQKNTHRSYYEEKKVIFDSFSFGSGTGSARWNLSGFSVPVQAATTSKKQTGFVKKNGSGTITG